jgi:hypothetical protein
MSVKVGDGRQLVPGLCVVVQGRGRKGEGAGVGKRYGPARTAQRRVDRVMIMRHHMLLAWLRGNSAALRDGHGTRMPMHVHAHAHAHAPLPCAPARHAPMHTGRAWSPLHARLVSNGCLTLRAKSHAKDGARRGA